MRLNENEKFHLCETLFFRTGEDKKFKLAEADNERSGTFDQVINQLYKSIWAWCGNIVDYDPAEKKLKFDAEAVKSIKAADIEDFEKQYLKACGIKNADAIVTSSKSKTMPSADNVKSAFGDFLNALIKEMEGSSLSALKRYLDTNLLPVLAQQEENLKRLSAIELEVKKNNFDAEFCSMKVDDDANPDLISDEIDALDKLLTFAENKRSNSHAAKKNASDLAKLISGNIWKTRYDKAKYSPTDLDLLFIDFFNAVLPDINQQDNRLKSLVRSEIESFGADGFDPELNPFIGFFLKKDKKVRNSELSYEPYAAMHNAYVKDVLSRQDLIEEGLFKSNNIIFVPDFWKFDYQTAYNVLRLQSKLANNYGYYSSDESSETAEQINAVLKKQYSRSETLLSYCRSRQEEQNVIFNRDLPIFNLPESQTYIEDHPLKNLRDKKILKYFCNIAAVNDRAYSKVKIDTGYLNSLLTILAGRAWQEQAEKAEDVASDKLGQSLKNCDGRTAAVARLLIYIFIKHERFLTAKKANISKDPLLSYIKGFLSKKGIARLDDQEAKNKVFNAYDSLIYQAANSSDYRDKIMKNLKPLSSVGTDANNISVTDLEQLTATWGKKNGSYDRI